MTKIKDETGPTDVGDGGPAFPCAQLPPRSYAYGLSLLDYFAKGAMEGMVMVDQANNNWETVDAIAKSSYKMAQAMLKERKRITGQ